MTLDRFTGIQRACRNRPLLIVDIAVPRDFDPRIGELEQVMLYDVDDLRAQVERNLSDRRERLEKAGRSSNARRPRASPLCDTAGTPGPYSASSPTAPRPRSAASSTASSSPGPT